MNVTQKNFSNAFLWLFVFLAGILTYHFCFGISTLAPTNISWIMNARHDWGQHYLGWAFYRHEPWTFPIGTINNWYYPAGTNVGFTDSIPLPAILLKPFSSFLPVDFQYLGIWIASCLIVSGIYTVLILKRFGASTLQLLIAAVFVMANPVLIFRGLHPALCTHWLILGGILCYLKANNVEDAKKVLTHQYVLLLLAATINPYLWLMSAGFTFFISLRLWKEKNITLKVFLSYNALSLVSTIVIWWIIGLITFGGSEELAVSGAYGLYGMNLNQLFNGSGFSRFFPNLPFVSWHQYEGFMYPGIGIYIVLTISAVLTVFFSMQGKIHPRTWIKKHRIALIYLCLFSLIVSVFAISNVVTLNDKVLFKIYFPDPLIKLGEVFRASARFFWIPYYFLIIGSLALLVKLNIRGYIKAIILFLAVCIQLYDITGLINSRQAFLLPYAPLIDYPGWEKVINKFNNIITYPPFEGQYVNTADYQDFSYLAAKGQHGITVGYVARGNYAVAREFVRTLDSELLEGHIREGDLYITTGAKLVFFKSVLQNGEAHLYEKDSYYYLYSGDVRKELESGGNIKKLDSIMRIMRSTQKVEKTNQKITSTNSIVYNFTEYKKQKHFFILSGWAFDWEQKNQPDDSIFLLLRSKKDQYLVACNKMHITDMKVHFDRSDIDETGFYVEFRKDLLAEGSYEVSVGMKKRDGTSTFQATNRRMTIGQAPPEVEKLDISGLSGDIFPSVDVMVVGERDVEIVGWAVFNDMDAIGIEISIVLQKDNDYFQFPAILEFRPDVTTFFGNKFMFDNSGYRVIFDRSLLPPGEYTLGIHITNRIEKKNGFISTGRKVIL